MAEVTITFTDLPEDQKVSVELDKSSFPSDIEEATMAQIIAATTYHRLIKSFDAEEGSDAEDDYVQKNKGKK